MSEPTVVETSFPVRYAETDSMQIVHHSHYIVYFEEGRSAYARARGKPYSQFEKQGLFLAVTEIYTRHVQPAFYEQLITVRTWIAEIKSRSIKFEYEIIDANTKAMITTGWTKHMCIDRNGKITRIPDEWRDWATN
ncbi:MAG: acyl-CoA thioesterase [Chloroflexi bacterium]|nr:MAG: acyl-CoA thioesterase [Chloroflexota bacterium]